MPVIVGFLLALVLWFVMFSPWTSHLVNFWWMMTASGATLTAYAVVCSIKLNGSNGLNGSNSLNGSKGLRGGEILKQAALGIAIAFVLWWVFWTGDKLSQLMFDFARPQVDTIYSMKGNMPVWLIALLLLFVIGPAEEIFWRGFLQRNLVKYGQWTAFFVVLAGYSFVHIWSFNFMLLCAAAVCGFCWGLLYRFFPQWLPALVVSHALWDVAAFVVFPF